MQEQFYWRYKSGASIGWLPFVSQSLITTEFILLSLFSMLSLLDTFDYVM